MTEAMSCKGLGERFGSRCRRKFELYMVSAARMESGKGPLSLHSPLTYSSGQTQAGPWQARLGQVPVSSGHRWLSA